LIQGNSSSACTTARNSEHIHKVLSRASRQLYRWFVRMDGKIHRVGKKSFQLGFAVSSKIAVSMGVAPCNRPKHPISI